VVHRDAAVVPAHHSHRDLAPAGSGQAGVWVAGSDRFLSDAMSAPTDGPRLSATNTARDRTRVKCSGFCRCARQ
jgi:hypothetical protein